MCVSCVCSLLAALVWEMRLQQICVVWLRVLFDLSRVSRRIKALFYRLYFIVAKTRRRRVTQCHTLFLAWSQSFAGPYEIFLRQVSWRSKCEHTDLKQSRKSRLLFYRNLCKNMKIGRLSVDWLSVNATVVQHQSMSQLRLKIDLLVKSSLSSRSWKQSIIIHACLNTTV